MVLLLTALGITHIYLLAWHSIVGLITNFRDEGLRILLDLLWPLLTSIREWRNLDANILELLRKGTTALLVFNVFLSLVKILSVMLLLAYTAAQKQFSKVTLFTTVKFGDCIPDAGTLERAKRLDEILRDLVIRINRLLTMNPKDLDIKDAERTLKEAERHAKEAMIAGKEGELARWIKRSVGTQNLILSLPDEIIERSVQHLRAEEMRAENAQLADEAAGEILMISPNKINHTQKAHRQAEKRQATLNEAKRLHFDAKQMAQEFREGKVDANNDKRFREMMRKLTIDIDMKLARAEASES